MEEQSRAIEYVQGIKSLSQFELVISGDRFFCFDASLERTSKPLISRRYLTQGRLEPSLDSGVRYLNAYFY